MNLESSERIVSTYYEQCGMEAELTKRLLLVTPTRVLGRKHHDINLLHQLAIMQELLVQRLKSLHAHQVRSAEEDTKRVGNLAASRRI